MYRDRIVQALVAGVLVLGVVGCGGTAPTTPSSPAPAVSNLSGNWLLAGTIPEGPPFSGSSPGLSVTLSVVDSEVIGSGTVNVFCSTLPNTGFGFGQGFVVSGAVRADGTFTAQTPTLPSGLSALPITISGSVPSAPGEAWTGSYTIDASQQGASCNPELKGSFTATGIAAVTGTYTGTGTFGTGTSATPIGVTASLQQGGDTAAPQTSAQSSSALSGTISITGTSCFHSGTLVTPTTPALLPGDVAGDQVQADFKMDDGSQLLIVGYISDAQASALQVRNMLAFGGNCAGSQILGTLSPGVAFQLTSLTKQK
jgi:hypothetical protein